MKLLNRLVSLLYIALSTAFSVIAICCIGSATGLAGVGFVIGWLAIWLWEARR